MRKALARWIAKLEAINPIPTTIPIFVEDKEDTEKEIDRLIAAGEIPEADRHRCVYFLHHKHYSEWLRDAQDGKLRLDDPVVRRCLFLM